MGSLRARLRDLGSPLIARWEYYLKPSARDPLGGPFNGQQHRQRIFRELLDARQFRAIVETGTYKGSTTEHMARAATVPIRTVEARPKFYHYARLRLAAFPQVRVSLGDSRSHLRALAADPSVPKENVFFYLDAHWYDDLPLRDEVEIITGAWTHPVIMVDDFSVPDDAGYRFNDYGPGKRLDLDYLRPLSKNGLTAFFPSEPSARETGARRGCVVLTDAETAAALEASVPALRRHVEA